MVELARHADLERLNTLLVHHHVAALTGRIGSGTSLLLRSLEKRWAGRTVQIPYHRAEAAIQRSGLDIVLAGLRSLDAENFSIDVEGQNIPAFDLASTVLKALPSAEIPDNTLIIIPGCDDMDDTSQAALGHLLRRMSDPRVRIVISARRITDKSPFAGIPHLDLRTLRREEMIDLAHRATAKRICPAAAALAVRAAAGRPHALGLILQDMTESQQAGNFAMSVPLRLGPEAVSLAHDIVGQLDGTLEYILKMLSLAPLTCFSALQREIPDAALHVAELESRGVVERRGSLLMMTDELVRSAMHWSMSGSTRNALHQKLINSCSEHHVEMGNWHRSFLELDEQTAAALAANALSLVRGGLVDAGIELIERSISLCAEASALGERLTDLAEALIDRGEFVFAARYLQFARESTECPVTVRARGLEIQLEYLQSQTLPNRLLNNWTRGERSAAPREVARLQLILGHLHCDRREVAEARQLLKEAEALKEHFSLDEKQLHDGLRMSIDAVRGDDQLALARFNELSALESDELSPQYLLNMASALMLTEHYESARACLDVLMHTRSDNATWAVQAMYLKIEIAIRVGQIGHAMVLLDSLTDGLHPEHGVRRDRLLLMQCWQLLMSGRASDAEEKEAELAAYANKTGNGAMLAALSALQGSYLLRVGLHAEAARHLQRCDERCPGELNPNQYRHEPDLIEALIRCNRREHAALVLQRLRTRATRAPSDWAQSAIKRCEALLATGQQSVELLQDALRDHRGSVYTQALLHTALADRLATLGLASRSRDHTLIAASLFREIGAKQPVIPEPPSRPGSGASRSFPPELSNLSDEERLVAELVKAGLKNREIAARIYVSLRTVELRLTSVYRKLGVSSRTELVARLAGTPVREDVKSPSPHPSNS
ncbi:helix-turn-helix transcriptional regulator [Nesterenkonia rhizosphaerae]|uniref:HTH luxR-type domain-containing protein n=1 Tax=Nesterenkonia rhizosphaerae TaxID=1348272 RepID=A0ABP9FVW3_9MICC